jgi:transposase
MADPDLSTWTKLLPALNEVQRRWYAAQKALELGRGGIERVHELSGLSRTTVRKGIQEIQSSRQLDPSVRLRQPGGGRPRIEDHAPRLVRDLEAILDENTAGDPMSAIKWTSKSTRAIAAALQKKGHELSHDKVCRLLHERGYSLQANRKRLEGQSHPDRDGQFRYLNKTVKRFASRGDPVISVDCKKKEKVGNFKNAGRTWKKKGKPEEVLTHDFPHLGIGKAIPYGVYDIDRNAGMVNVGTSAETGEFAVESIRQWWKRFGRRHYPKGRRLLICADSGGGNGYRPRSWKIHLQRLADKTGLAIMVCHYPPGTSKWNKIEHRMFSFISLHWKGQPLVNYEAVINLIGSATTRKGLKVAARLDPKKYEQRVKHTDQEMRELRLKRHEPYPDWNYTISPRSGRKRAPRPTK